MNQNKYSICSQKRKKIWQAKFICCLILLASLSGALNAQQTYTFTTGGALGRIGPTQALLNTAYQTTNLNGLVTSTNGVQSFTVTGGLYRITAVGAHGGNSPSNNGGYGVSMQGDFTLPANAVINILVGQQGEVITSSGYNGGGGGGSFVWVAGQTLPLIAAGGGGGQGGSYNGDNAAITTSGTAGNPAAQGTPGTNGNGANPGGAGWFNDGASFTGGGCTVKCTGAVSGITMGGASPTTCIAGITFQGCASATGIGDGGFGGGSGGNGSCSSSYGAGGGGGYSGGVGQAAGTPNLTSGSAGGGGGSYNGGVNQVNAISTGTADGIIIIQELCNITLNSATTNSTNPPSICSGQSVTLSTNGISNYVWSTGNTTNSVIVVSPSVTTVYTLSATSPSNCTAVQSVTVIVNSAGPALTYSTVPSTGSVCLGQTVTLTAGGAVSYTLTNGTGTLVNGQTFTPTATTSYSITGKNGCGTASVIATINVAPLPVTAVASNTLICSGSPATLTAGGATNYTWTALSATSILTPYIVSPTANTTYSLYGVTGPCSGSTVITISTKPLPTLVASTSNSSICNGGSTSVNVSGNAVTYTWNPGNQNSTSISVTPTTTTLYSVIGTNSVNCTSGASQVVIVTPNPTVNVSVSNPVVCAGDASTLTASGADSYTWTSNTGVSIVVNPSSNSIYNVIGSYTATGCSSSATAAVSVLTPSIAVSGNTAVCSGSQVAVSASGATTYNWSNGGSGAGITITPTLTTVYTVTGSVVDPTTFISCDASNSVQVTVNANPVITASADHPVICLGTSAVLTADGAGANGTYTWTGGSGAVHTTTNLVTPIANQSYSVAGIDGNGCKGAAGISIQVSPCTGITNVAANATSLVVYPNPSNGEFTITSDQTINLQIINELGQQVRTLTFGNSSREVKVNGLANGVYFITGSNENGSVKEKIIIAK